MIWFNNKADKQWVYLLVLSDRLRPTHNYKPDLLDGHDLLRPQELHTQPNFSFSIVTEGGI